jgi:hypothetical protein
MQKLGWTERGGERASGGMLWNFQLRARGSGLGFPVRASGVCTENWIRLDAGQRLGNPAT